MDTVPGGLPIDKTLHRAAVATADGMSLLCVSPRYGGLTAVAFQITGISGDTITFEGTINGTNWVAIRAENLNDGTLATTATANGLYRVTCLGLTRVRARLTRSAGTVTVVAQGVA